MRSTINGVRYDTSDCRKLASFNHYSNNLYAGSTSLLEAGDGNILVWTDSNGQDGYLHDSLDSWEDWKTDREYGNMKAIDLFNQIDDEARLVALGLLTICPKVKGD